MLEKPLNQVWDLDSLFAGGSASTEFEHFLAETDKQIREFRQAVHQLNQSEPGKVESTGSNFLKLVKSMQEILQRLHESDSFVSCLTAQNQEDQEALLLSARVKTWTAKFESALTWFDQYISKLPESLWQKLLVDPEIAEVSFPLQERRTLARQKMTPDKEALVSDLAVDGYHAWGELYQSAVRRVRVPFDGGEGTEELSAGQAANRLLSLDHKGRSKLFGDWEKAWGREADLCADALNRLSGFRLQLYRNREWDSVLREPLFINRMSQQTLNTMWTVIEQFKPIFVRYLQRKAELIGVKKLSWFDVEAPIGASNEQISYEQAANTIVEQFRKFSPNMAEFAEQAIASRWIEAEDRTNKRPGGFCTSFPVHHQTRIYMTYAGTPSNVSTLAHELGHAYHQHVMEDMPVLSQQYAMNVAETASTFAEMIVSDAQLEGAETDKQKIIVLEDKIQRSVAFFMNIHARFLFETRMYHQRKSGPLSIQALNELMEQAQREAFCNELDQYHPYFWASKLHFYITDVPFYNFPYTFGYLFSSGIYKRAKQEGRVFADKYAKLLRDTGSMTVEKLAQKHLGVDLTKPEFWEQAVKLSVRDVQEFLDMTMTKTN